MKTVFEDIVEFRYLIISAAVCLLLLQLIFHKICPVVIITGFPCPGCGITRALLLLVTGHPILAWQMNPCIYIWLICFIAAFYLHYVKKNDKAVNRLLLITGIITLTVYAVRMYMYYPDRIPYVYYKNSLFSRLSAFFGYTP